MTGQIIDLAAKLGMDPVAIRLRNDPSEEIRIAAGEHAEICERRLLADV